jgi:hypothetical protein
MSRFKDVVAKDMDSVFLNLDEFAEYHMLDGKRIKCVVSVDVEKSATPEGIFISTLTVYVKASSLAQKPIEGELWNIDGEFHFVRNVSDEMGMLVVVTEANAQ